MQLLGYPSILLIVNLNLLSVPRMIKPALVHLLFSFDIKTSSKSEIQHMSLDAARKELLCRLPYPRKSLVTVIGLRRGLMGLGVRKEAQIVSLSRGEGKIINAGKDLITGSYGFRFLGLF